MRRTFVALTAVAATALTGAAPVSAAEPVPAPAPALGLGLGWEPAPSAPWDVAAGLRCDFAIHGEQIVDEVVKRVLSTHPDGSPNLVAYKGDLVVRVTNKDTGAAYDADASGTAVVDYRSDGSQFWSVLGPVLVGVGEDAGNLERGLYIIDGVYTLDISSSGYKTVTMAHGTTTDICDQID
ncbi:hypothetical protein [Streptomyces peucetius]|uniref:Secreted protein n=1 Tax=Streptomyces peucetius TaxID=1950 RepID=A0ABY6I4G1_STRPE|nr:hypothetical protein [Streptomyces peucetius]UYQ61155.1 hypothetical protein OGH68_06525 [Streptomyces peucetius]